MLWWTSSFCSWNNESITIYIIHAFCATLSTISWDSIHFIWFKLCFLPVKSGMRQHSVCSFSTCNLWSIQVVSQMKFFHLCWWIYFHVVPFAYLLKVYLWWQIWCLLLDQEMWNFLLSNDLPCNWQRWALLINKILQKWVILFPSISSHMNLITYRLIRYGKSKLLIL